MFEKLFAKIGVTLMGATVVGGAGMVAGIAYENTVPWGLRAQRDRVEASIPRERREAAKVQYDKDRRVVLVWQERLEACEAARTDQSEAEAARLDAAQQHTSQSRDAAYNLGRQAGLAQCRRSPANAEDRGTDGNAVPPSGLLPDDVELRELLAGAAYAPSPR